MRRASHATQPRYSAIALGGVPIKKIRCTEGELARNTIPFLLRPIARKNRETAFVLAWGKATPSPEAVDNADSRKRTCSRKVPGSETASCFPTTDSNAFKHSSKVEASKSRRRHAGSIATSKSFAVTSLIYPSSETVARPFSIGLWSSHCDLRSQIASEWHPLGSEKLLESPRSMSTKYIVV
jgi:hypothetical protein